MTERCLMSAGIAPHRNRLSLCEEEAVEIIGVIVMGIIIGLLGKFVAPGNRDNIPIWLTILCGIVGVLIGYGWLGGTKGIDWLAFFVSIIFAAILVMIAATVTGRSGRKV